MVRVSEVLVPLNHAPAKPTPGQPTERRDRGQSPTLPDFAPGTVWMVGAGPGDPGLLTLLAVRALEQADVVLHDALVGDEILGLSNPKARLEDVGKRGGKASSHRQPAITARLIALAQQGLRVLRLKGGDPFVFGRGGEEAEALAAAGIAFRIVPGVTAGTGGLAQAGIPVTHRSVGSAVTFVTGHGSSGAVPDGLDWSALAHSAPTLVVYMGLRTLETIAARLMKAGRSPMTPVAVVTNAALPDQSVILTDLARCARDARRMSARAPAIIAIGDVVRLNEVLAAHQLFGSEERTVAETSARAPILRQQAAVG